MLKIIIYIDYWYRKINNLIKKMEFTNNIQI